MKKQIIVWLFLIWNIATAQEFNLAGIEYKHHPASSLTNKKAGKISFNELSAYVNIPIQFKNDKTILVIGPRYERLEYQIQEPSIEFTSTLHKVSVNFLALHKWNKKWTSVFSVRPGIGSDFKKETSLGPLLFESSALLIKKQKKGLSIGAGLLYTNYIGKGTFLPLGLVNYKVGNHTIDAVLPSSAKYHFQLNEKYKLQLGAAFSFTNGTFNSTLPNYTFVDSSQIEDIVFSQLNIGPSVKARFAKNIQLEVVGGLTTLRKFDFRDFNKASVELSPANNGFFQIGLKYIFINDQK